MKITEYGQITAFDASTIFLTDGSGGTKKVLATDVLRAILEILPVDQRRGFFGGKLLGTSVSSAQLAAIRDGSFKGMMIGDYWTISSVNYRIADFDYFYNCGDTQFTKHHAVIVPDKGLYNAKMNTDNVTTGGYTGSQMYTENLESAKTTIKAAFPEMVLSHRDYFVNAVAGGKPSGGGWFASEIDLMNEIMVYGCHVFEPANDGVTVPCKYTTGNSQLALFRLNPKFIKTRESYWLRDVVSAAYFAIVNHNGNTNYNYASNSVGVRPEFCIG